MCVSVLLCALCPVSPPPVAHHSVHCQLSKLHIVPHVVDEQSSPGQTHGQRMLFTTPSFNVYTPRFSLQTLLSGRDDGEDTRRIQKVPERYVNCRLSLLLFFYATLCSFIISDTEMSQSTLPCYLRLKTKQACSTWCH